MTYPIRTYELKIHTDPTGLDPENTNVDVFITFSPEERYAPSFFTLKNIETIMKRHQTTGESKSGLYFWASEMIIVEKITEPIIREVIDELIRTGELGKVTARLENLPEDTL